jgi:Cu-Zn family superoxide dismutase
MRYLLLSLALLLFAATLWAVKEPNVTVSMKDAQGKDVGTITLKTHGKGVEIKANLENLPPGEHAIHFHREAKCEAPDFKSAGPHFNPSLKKHGLDNPDGPHDGDNPNFTVDAKGKAKFSIANKNVTLGEDSHSVFSSGGASLVIHAKADDQKTDPSGNSGDRIACGVIAR